VDTEYDIRFASGDAAEGSDQLARHAPSNLRRAYERIRSAPEATDNPQRHHRLKGELGSATFKGETLARWQHEVTGGGRIWFLLDNTRRTVWITYAGTGHPSSTD
jgi:hypothetical protein